MLTFLAERGARLRPGLRSAYLLPRCPPSSLRILPVGESEEALADERNGTKRRINQLINGPRERFLRTNKIDGRSRHLSRLG